jgi:hypothetical protein
MRLFLTIFCAVSLAACTQSSNADVKEASLTPARIERVGDVLHYDGTIMPGDAARVRGLLDEDVKTVVINSAGGDGPEAIDIGRAFADVDSLQIRVSHWCLSGCAQFLFVAAKEKVVEPGGVVACHHNPFALDRINRKLWENQVPDDYQDFLDDARAYYAQLGVSEEYGMICMVGQGLACVEDAYNQKAAFRTVFHYFVPTEEQFERFGVKNIRFESPPLKDGGMQNAFGTFHNMEYQASEARLRRVRSCDDVQRDAEERGLLPSQ